MNPDSPQLIRCRRCLGRQSTLDSRLKAILRCGQTSISLGDLNSARLQFGEARQEIDSLDPDKCSSLRLHSEAVWHRHQSTLHTVSILLSGLNSSPPDSDELQSMFDKAVVHAEQCEKGSEALRGCSEYLGRPDYTGTGIAILKKAQAELAIGLFAQAAQHAQEAGSRLAAYPNNRWWRMACYDTAARAFARLHDRASAEREYQMAYDIWEDSSREDMLRNFELTCTRALIEMETGDLNEALKRFSQIASYTSDSVPPKAVYLFYYLEAAAKAHDRTLITELLGKMSKLKVKW